MDVILMKSVDKLGEMGEIVSVARGYARNCLIPQGLASLVTEGQKVVIAEKVRLTAVQDEKTRVNAEALAAKHKDLSCTITVNADEDDNLFGSVNARDITAAMVEQNVEFEHQQIVLEEPIKQLGVYSIQVKLHAEVEVTIKVWVVKAE